MKINAAMYDYTGSEQTTVGDVLMYEFDGYSPFTEIKQLIFDMKAKMLHILESSNIKMDNLSVELYGNEGYKALNECWDTLINEYEIEGIDLCLDGEIRAEDDWTITIELVKITRPVV